MLDFSTLIWEDHPENPLLDPPWPEWILADPTVVTPGESPDGQWHLFAHTLVALQHYTSADGTLFHRESSLFQGLRPFLYKEKNLFHLLYEYLDPPLGSRIVMRSSKDLREWTEPVTLLRPTLDWHGTMFKRVGNPCLIKVKGEYRLYYSANHVLLKDCAFTEPRYIGMARSDSLEGPYAPDPQPQLTEDETAPYHNLGAGAMKVLYDGRRRKFWGFNNGIWTDEKGRSRSAILLLSSKDGEHWVFEHETPIIAPTEGWKEALVYALDVKEVDGRAYLYYNARDGWLFGRERIGLCIGTPPA